MATFLLIELYHALVNSQLNQQHSAQHLIQNLIKGDFLTTKGEVHENFVVNTANLLANKHVLLSFHFV